MRPRWPQSLGVSSWDTQEVQPPLTGLRPQGTVSRWHPALALSQRGLADRTAGVGGGRGRSQEAPRFLWARLLVSRPAPLQGGPESKLQHLPPPALDGSVPQQHRGSEGGCPNQGRAFSNDASGVPSTPTG